MRVSRKSTLSPKADRRLRQLLQLKRSERPEPEFWEDFSQKFRARQMASLVQYQPWYARLGRQLASLSRKALMPLAGAAALALALLAATQTANLIASLSIRPEAKDTKAPESYFVIAEPAGADENSPPSVAQDSAETAAEDPRRFEPETLPASYARD